MSSAVWKIASTIGKNLLFYFFVALGVASLVLATSPLVLSRIQYVHLFWRALHSMPVLVSGNWAQVVMAVGIFIVAELLTLVFRGPEAMKRQWGESLGIGVAAVLMGWIGLFAYSVVVTVNEDHQSLARRNGELVRKNRELADANSHLVDPKSRDDEIAKLKRKLAERQPLHTAVPATPPAVKIAEQKEIIPSPRPEEKHALQVTIEATGTIQPVHLRLQCDGPLHDVYLREPERLQQYSYGVVPGELNIAEVTFTFPPIDKTRPVVVLLFSNQPVKVINVRNIQ